MPTMGIIPPGGNIFPFSEAQIQVLIALWWSKAGSLTELAFVIWPCFCTLSNLRESTVDWSSSAHPPVVGARIASSFAERDCKLRRIYDLREVSF